MDRLNLGWWCGVGSAINDLSNVKAGDLFASAYALLTGAAQFIIANHLDTALVRLRVSENSAVQIVQIVERVTHDPARTDPITVEEAAALQNKAKDYKTVLEAELQNVDAYYVRPKGIFDSRRLIDAADEVLGADVAVTLSPDTRADLRAAGRCLAFELATASGFHVARATETVILEMMAAAGCPPHTKSGQRNWGAYLVALESTTVDAKVTEHLKQVKDLHRNPLIHPEYTLSMQEALALWTVCTGLIGTMRAEIDRLKAKATS